MTDAKATAPDLSKVDPRPMDEKLEGYEWLPRMIDKARASAAGTLGDYYKYPCPLDRMCLQQLGIDAETFRNISTKATADTEALYELKKLGIPSAEEAAFDPVGLNETFHKGGS